MGAVGAVGEQKMRPGVGEVVGGHWKLGRKEDEAESW